MGVFPSSILCSHHSGSWAELGSSHLEQAFLLAETLFNYSLIIDPLLHQVLISNFY